MFPNIDPTTTNAWKKLEEYYFSFEGTELKELFAIDPKRFENYSLRFEDILVDFSKNIIDDKMIHVDTIGREIKHWFIPKERHKIIIDLSLSSLSKAQLTSYVDRMDAIHSYLQNYNPKSPIKMEDIRIIMKNIQQLSNNKIETITEIEILDAIAIDIYNKFRNADPPSVLAEIFNEINNLTQEVGRNVLEILIKNQRIEEKVDQMGNRHYYFLTI